MRARAEEHGAGREHERHRMLSEQEVHLPGPARQDEGRDGGPGRRSGPGAGGTERDRGERQREDDRGHQARSALASASAP